MQADKDGITIMREEDRLYWERVADIMIVSSTEPTHLTRGDWARWLFNQYMAAPDPRRIEYHETIESYRKILED